MSDLTKEQKEQQIIKANEEAKKRAEQLDIVGNKFLTLAQDEDITVNDLQYILNSLVEQLALVFRSRKINDFMSKKEDKVEPTEQV